MLTVQTFAVRETDVSRHNGGTSGAPFKPLRDDSALRALSYSPHRRGAGGAGCRVALRQPGSHGGGNLLIFIFF